MFVLIVVRLLLLVLLVFVSSALTELCPKAADHSTVVLIVGVAGHLGAHLARHLYSSCEVNHVIGIDRYRYTGDMDAVVLRRQRAKALLQLDNKTALIDKSLQYYDGSICNQLAIKHLYIELNKISYSSLHIYIMESVPLNCRFELISYTADHVKSIDPVRVYFKADHHSADIKPSVIGSNSNSRVISIAVDFSDRGDQVQFIGSWPDPTTSTLKLLTQLATLRTEATTAEVTADVSDQELQQHRDVTVPAAVVVDEALATLAIDKENGGYFVSTIDAVIALAALLNNPIPSKQVRPFDNLSSKPKSPSIASSLQQQQQSLQQAVAAMMRWQTKYEAAQFPCASECHSKQRCFASVWDAAAAESKRLSQSRGCKVVVYTVATGAAVDALHDIDANREGNDVNISAADEFNSKEFSSSDSNSSSSSSVGIRENGTCNFAFISRYSALAQNSSLQQALRNWTFIAVDEFGAAFADSRKPTRVPKMNPGAFFAASVEYAVYLDSKLQLTNTISPLTLIEVMRRSRLENQQQQQHANNSVNDTEGVCSLSKVGAEVTPGSIGFVAVRLPLRSEVAAEFSTVHQLLRNVRSDVTYYPTELLQQEAAYKAYAAHHKLRLNNLIDGAFLIHDLRSAVARKFRCRWFEEYLRWSDRDQPCAAYALSRAALDSGVAISKATDFIPLGAEPTAAAAAVGTDANASHTYAWILNTRPFHWKSHTHCIADLKKFEYNRPESAKIIKTTKKNTGPPAYSRWMLGARFP